MRKRDNLDDDSPAWYIPLPPMKEIPKVYNHKHWWIDIDFDFYIKAGLFFFAMFSLFAK